MRKTLSVEEIGKVCEVVREVNPCAAIMVDNCYGEFTETIEPTQVGADIIAGSLIKNPGGGLAPTGGYIAGRRDLVENASYKLTAPGIGGECGCTMGQNRLLFQGLFMAPHITAQALKTAIFCAQVMEKRIPKAGLAVLEGAGHFSYVDKYAQFCAVMKAFFA